MFFNLPSSPLCLGFTTPPLLSASPLHPLLIMAGHKSWTVTRQRDRDESAGCHGNLEGCWDPGEGLGCVPELRHLDDL